MKLTHHGEKRIRERVGVPLRSVERVAKIALEKGIRHSDTSGQLSRYFSSLYLKSKKARNIRIYGQKVYIFRGDLLITTFSIPRKFIATVVKIAKQKKGGSNDSGINSTSERSEENENGELHGMAS